MNVVFADQIEAVRSIGAGGGVEDFFAELGRAHLGHELGDGARGVVFALVPGVSQFDKDGLVNGAENVTVVGVVEVEAVELIDDFAHLEARLHVVVRAVEDFAHDGGALGAFADCSSLRWAKRPSAG